MLSLHKKMNGFLRKKNIKLKTEKPNRKPWYQGNKQLKPIQKHKLLNHPILMCVWLNRTNICLFYSWFVQVFIWVIWHLDGMNSKRCHVFPNYFQPQLEPSLEEWTLKWHSDGLYAFILFLLKVALAVVESIWWEEYGTFFFFFSSFKFIPSRCQTICIKTWTVQL